MQKKFYIVISSAIRSKTMNIMQKNIAISIFMVYCLLLIFQNSMAMVATQFSFIGAKAILGLKDMILFSAFIVAILNIFYLGRGDKSTIISILIVFSIFLLAAANVDTALMSLRQLLIIPLSLIFGTLLFKSNVDFKFVFHTYIYTVFFITMFAYFELFLFYDESEFFWNVLGVKEYMEMKGMTQWANEFSNVSNSFYSYDFYNFTGDKIRRMVSIIAEPTIFGQLLVLPSIYYILRKRYIYALFFIVSIFLALSKGGFVGVFVGIILYLWQEKSNKFLRTILLITTSIIMIIIVFIYINNYVQSITNHLNGFLSNFAILPEHPFGLGIGNAGNYHALYASGNSSTAGESYLGAIVGQFGVIGLFLYFLFFRYVYKCKTNNIVMLNTTKYTILATLITGSFSESAITYVGTSLLLILTAYLINYQREGNGL